MPAQGWLQPCAACHEQVFAVTWTRATGELTYDAR